MPLKTIKIRTAFQRAALVGAAFLLAGFAAASVKWSLGHLISIRAEQKEVADVSTEFAPDDPQTHYSSAVLHEKTLLPGDLEKSLAGYERAAALAPNDYLLWLAYGKALDRAGDAKRAENVLRRALELAPNYAETHWTLGNNLLRQRKTSEAFELIRSAALSSDRYMIPAIATAWDVFGGDIASVRQNIGDSPKLGAFLAVFLVKQERFEAGFDVWNSLPPEERSAAFRPQSEEIYKALVGAARFRFARRVKNALDGAAGKELTEIVDGGFEDNVKKQTADFFEWRIGEGAQPLIGFDDRIKHGGNSSLVMIFNSPDGQDFRTVKQAVAVEPGRSYRVEGFYKTELKAAGTFRWEVLGAVDQSVLAATDALEAATDWTGFSMDFTAPDAAEAVIINLARVRCDSTICPITGKVWFDDFKINAK